MYPKGTIYNIFDFRKSGPHGEVNLHASKGTKIFYTVARGVGAGLVGFVAILLLFTFGPLVTDEINYSLGRNKIDYKESQVNLINANNTSVVQEESRALGVNSYFSIVIPKIGAKANIIANVDSGNEEEYSAALKEGVAHAKGTYFPGQGRQIFLFAHSTNSPFNVSRYNAVFYLLDKLQAGDKIIIYFSDRRYLYEVAQTKIVGPRDISFFGSDSGEVLILQTCYPPGTSWNRLLVLAKPV